VSTEETRDYRFYRVYPAAAPTFNAAKFTDVVLEVTHRKERLGHFGFFNSGSEERWWPIALEWLAYGRSPKLGPMTTGTSNELEGP